MAKLCASGKGRVPTTSKNSDTLKERRERETEGGKEASVSGWVRGVFCRDSSTQKGTVDFPGINDKRPMIEALRTPKTSGFGERSRPY